MVKKGKAENGEGSLFRRHRMQNGKKKHYGNWILQTRDASGKLVWENLETKNYDVARRIRADRVARNLAGEAPVGAPSSRSDST